MQRKFVYLHCSKHPLYQYRIHLLDLQKIVLCSHKCIKSNSPIISENWIWRNPYKMNFLTIHPIYNTHFLFCHTTKKVLHFWVCCLHAFNRVLIRVYRKLNTWGRNSYPASCLWYFSKVLYGEASLYNSSKFTININFIINRNKTSSKVNKKNNLTIAIPFVTRPLSLLLNFLATSRKLGDKIRPYFNIFCLAYENQIYIYVSNFNGWCKIIHWKLIKLKW